jgi:hypothetical protein
MKYFLALMVILLFTKVSAQDVVDEYFVSDISQTNTVKISTDDLNKLLKECGFTSNITELKVQKMDEQYYLLAKDIAQKWILAFDLKSVGTKLFIDKYKRINACESNNLSISIFRMVDGQIDGCFNVNHHTFSKF